ncbi:MAG: OstA-like protein [Bacteroidota bacterium]
MHNYVIIILSIPYLLLNSTCCFAQKPTKIEIVNADILEYDEQLGSNIRRLIGNVAFKQDNVLLYCDSAYMYPEKNSLDAFSKVHINQGDTLNIYGDLLNYNGNTKMAELHGNVKLIQEDMTLTTEHLNYDINENMANYYNGGNVIDKNNNLSSIKGYYYSNTRLFFFKDSVVLLNPEYTMNTDTLKYNTITEIAYFFGPTTIISKNPEGDNGAGNIIYCENGWYDTRNDLSQFNKNSTLQFGKQTITGDSLFYDKDKGYGQAFDNVEITDTVENIIINGNYAEYFEESDLTIITGNAMLTQIYDEDSLFLHADTLKATYDSTGKNRIMYAYYKVKFYKSDLQGSCDSLIYAYSDSIIQLYDKPVLWSDENQFTAEYIEIKTNDEGISSLWMYNDAFIISRVESPGNYEKDTALTSTGEDTIVKDESAVVSLDPAPFNQIKGKNMTGYFIDNHLHKIKVTGNGQTIYYAQEDDGFFIGVNKADCSDMLIIVKDNTIETITFLTKPGATLYPMNDLKPDDLLFKDFKWFDEKRPMKKEDIFVWE